MFAPGDPFQSFVDACFERSGQATEEDCPGILWGRKQGKVTVAEGFERMSADRSFEGGWAYFLLVACRDILTEEQQSFLVKLIASRDTIWLAILLREREADLPARLVKEVADEITPERLPTVHKERNAAARIGGR